jgi:hypothetical protein
VVDEQLDGGGAERAEHLGLLVSHPELNWFGFVAHAWCQKEGYRGPPQNADHFAWSTEQVTQP